DANLEAHLDVQPEMIPADEGLRALPRNADRDRRHHDLLRLMQDGKGEAAAVDDNFPPAEAGADERRFPGCLEVKCAKEQDCDEQKNKRANSDCKPNHPDLPWLCNFPICQLLRES